MAPSEARDWSELPSDMLSVIFNKIGAFGVLSAAQHVCLAWPASAKHDPLLWRCVDMLNSNASLELARFAVDRAGGKLESFCGESCCDGELLKYIAQSTKSLKSLRLISCNDLFNEEFVEAVKHFPLLEELELTLCENVYGKVFEQVGRACPQLKHFRLNGTWYNGCRDDSEALAIAKYMPGLRHLQLFGNGITRNGLEAILDGCPHLETLDIRHCFDVEMYADPHWRGLYADLKAICANIKSSRLPHDSIADYKYRTNCDYFERVASRPRLPPVRRSRVLRGVLCWKPEY